MYLFIYLNQSASNYPFLLFDLWLYELDMIWGIIDVIHFERSEGKAEDGSSNRYFLKTVCTFWIQRQHK